MLTVRDTEWHLTEPFTVMAALRSHALSSAQIKGIAYQFAQAFFALSRHCGMPFMQDMGFQCLHINPSVYHDLLRSGDGSPEGLLVAFFDAVSSSYLICIRLYQSPNAIRLQMDLLDEEGTGRMLLQHTPYHRRRLPGRSAGPQRCQSLLGALSWRRCMPTSSST